MTTRRPGARRRCSACCGSPGEPLMKDVIPNGNTSAGSNDCHAGGLQKPQRLSSQALACGMSPQEPACAYRSLVSKWQASLHACRLAVR